MHIPKVSADSLCWWVINSPLPLPQTVHFQRPLRTEFEFLPPCWGGGDWQPSVIPPPQRPRFLEVLLFKSFFF